MIGDSRVTQSRSDAIDAVNAVFVMAASAAPATMNEKLLERGQVKRYSNARHIPILESYLQEFSCFS